MHHIQYAGRTGRQEVTHAPQQATYLRLRLQELKDAIWGDDQIERATERKVRNIAEHDLGFACWNLRLLQLLAATRQHRLGDIDALNGTTPCRQWDEHT